MDFTLIWQTLPDLLRACAVTLELTFISLFFGFIIAAPLGVLAARQRGVGCRLAEIYMFIFRGTPLLVQIFLIYAGLAQFDAVRGSFLWLYLREAFICALIALSLNSAAYTASIFKGAILSVPKGELQAAKACGFTPWQQYLYIIFPQAFRLALPAYGNEVLAMLKSTSLACTITVVELTGAAKNIYAENYAPYEAFITAAALYWLISCVLSALLQFLEHKFSGKSYFDKKHRKKWGKNMTEGGKKKSISSDIL